MYMSHMIVFVRMVVMLVIAVVMRAVIVIIVIARVVMVVMRVVIVMMVVALMLGTVRGCLVQGVRQRPMRGANETHPACMCAVISCSH